MDSRRRLSLAVLNQNDEDRMHGNDEGVPLASLELGTQMIHGAISRVAR